MSGNSDYYFRSPWPPLLAGQCSAAAVGIIKRVLYLLTTTGWKRIDIIFPDVVEPAAAAAAAYRLICSAAAIERGEQENENYHVLC